MSLKISKYSYLVAIYLISVMSSSIANVNNFDVQNLYRFPLLNIRWIDIAILAITFSLFYDLITKQRKLRNINHIVLLCFIYLIFELFQFYRSWALIDTTAQISHLICTFSLFIVIDLSLNKIPIERIISFLRKFAIWGAFVLIISNFYLLYSFFTGNVVIEDLDIRVVLEVEGSKETVYSFILTSSVYAFSLYFIQHKCPLWEKILFIFAILSIILALVITIFRGTLVMVLIISLYFIFSSPNAKQMIFKIVGIFLFISLGYSVFGDALAKKGYDPMKKIIEIAEFSVDVENPSWDKGRAVAQEIAINAWKKNIWIGAGYDELVNYGLSEDEFNPHNGVITSLFHRGIIGTFMLMLIFILLFKHAINLWLILKKDKTYQSDLVKLLILVTFLWIITFTTQEAIWEKYSLSIEFLYLGLITNIYKQQIELHTKYPMSYI